MNRYLNGPGANQVLAEESGISGGGAGDNHWALADHEGSVRDVVDDAGSSENHIVYDSFGNVVSQTPGGYILRMGYTGRREKGVRSQ